MEFKGTKGKWFQSHRKDPDSKKGMYSTQVYDENGSTIATLSWFPMPAVKENGQIKVGTFREQNAKLIASAPEMFEELVKIMETYDKGTETYIRVMKLLTKITE